MYVLFVKKLRTALPSNLGKVCHITTAHPAMDTRIFYREALTLAKAGFDVFLIGNYSKQETLNQVTIIPLKSYRNRFARMTLKPFRALYLAIKSGSRIYHFHDPELIPAGLLLKILGKKVIFDAHEDYPNLIKVKDWIPKKLRNVMSRLYAFLEYNSTKFFDLTIGPSDEAAKRLPKGMGLCNFPTDEMAYALALNSRAFKERKIDLIHVGVLRKERLDFFIRVLAKIRLLGIEPTIVFIGLSENQIRYIEDALGPYNHLKLFGKISFLQVAKFLSQAKIGLNYHIISSHLSYTFPVKVFEYLAAGCVVVSSAFPFLEQTMGIQNNPVFFVNGDSTEYANLLVSLLSNQDQLESVAATSKSISSYFRWETEGKKLVLAYQKLMDAK